MMRFNLLFCALCATFFAGCGSKTPICESLNHLERAPMDVPVRSIEVHMHPNAAKSSFERNFVKSQLCFMAEQWAKDALKSAGGHAVLRVTILRAIIEEKEIPYNHSFISNFEVQAKDKYQGELKVQFSWIESNQSKRHIELHFKAERVNMENMSLHQRQLNIMVLQNELINRLNEEARQTLSKIAHMEDL